MSITISAKQRDVLYDRMIDQLEAFNDVLSAAKRNDLEAAYRMGRRFSDALHLIVDGLGWGCHAAGDVELKLPEQDLRRIMSWIFEDASTQHEAERPEQEEVRQTWERTELVRDTCAGVLEQLRSGELSN